jgi:GTP pyrophosphokinase
MERKSIAFEQLSDIYGFRVIVAETDDCYHVLGAVHMKWPMVPGRFKDYISIPKQNDYRSLHTTVIGPGHQRVELQIRTEDMNEVARDGIAAHFLYKDFARGGRDDSHDGVAPNGADLSQESNAYRWLQRTLALLSEGDSPEEFLEHTKLELFHDQVFCFTPKGSLIALPRGATPIDFAYAVHTDVGNSAVGAKINGRMAPLITELNNGDEVEIVRAANQVPPAAWEGLVITGKARAAIRKATREAVRKQYRGLGLQIVSRAFERAGQTFVESELRAALPRLARTSVDDVLSAVGRGEMFSGDVLKAVHPELNVTRPPPTGIDRKDAGWFGLKKASRLVFKVPDGEESESAIPIRGQGDDLPVRFAPNGGAVPGDRIVGILQPGEGITIYPIQSPALSAFDNQPDLWLDVRWDLQEGEARRFPAQIKITSINEPGTLGIITTLIGETGANIDNLAFVTNSPDFNDIVIDLDVYDLKHLTALITRLKAKSVVSNVERMYG